MKDTVSTIHDKSTIKAVINSTLNKFQEGGISFDIISNALERAVNRLENSLDATAGFGQSDDENGDGKPMGAASKKQKREVEASSSLKTDFYLTAISVEVMRECYEALQRSVPVAKILMLDEMIDGSKNENDDRFLSQETSTIIVNNNPVTLIDLNSPVTRKSSEVSSEFCRGRWINARGLDLKIWLPQNK